MCARRSSDLFPLDFEPGRILSGRYRVESKLGQGWEGEVYKIREISTGIEKVAKFYFPERDPGGRSATRYARKLHILSESPIITQYHHRDWIRLRRAGQDFKLEYLVSQFAEGEMLSAFLKQQRGNRLPAFEALHLLHALAKGVATIHGAGQYHGDIHSDNILVKRRGIRFKVKLLDFFDLGRPTRAKKQDDIADLAGILYEAIGGPARYSVQPAIVKHLCAGRRRDLIVKRFPDVDKLLRDMEEFPWD